MSIIETQGLVKTFNAGQPNEVQPVRAVDLRVEAGEWIVLKGPSGSGKTTLLTLLACLAKPTAGVYRCRGEVVSRWSEKFLTRFRQAHVGVVFQQFNLIEGFTAAENIALPLLPRGWGGRRVDEAVARAAAQAAITHRLTFPVEQLSGGELQRVAIARALVADPALLFADEPTANLDSDLSRQMLTVFSDLKARGKTLVVTTHDPLVEHHLAVDRVVTMQDGRIIP